MTPPSRGGGTQGHYGSDRELFQQMLHEHDNARNANRSLLNQMLNKPNWDANSKFHFPAGLAKNTVSFARKKALARAIIRTAFRATPMGRALDFMELVLKLYQVLARDMGHVQSNYFDSTGWTLMSTCSSKPETVSGATGTLICLGGQGMPTTPVRDIHNRAHVSNSYYLPPPINATRYDYVRVFERSLVPPLAQEPQMTHQPLNAPWAVPRFLPNMGNTAPVPFTNPAPLPFRWPSLGNSPMPYGHTEGNTDPKADPKKQPQPKADPAPGRKTQVDVISVRPFARPPKSREKEVKFIMGPKGTTLLVYNFLTEVEDFLDATYWALKIPKGGRPKPKYWKDPVGHWHKAKMPIQDKAMFIYKNLDTLDPVKWKNNLIKNELTDATYGALGAVNRKTNQQRGIAGQGVGTVISHGPRPANSLLEPVFDMLGI